MAVRLNVSVPEWVVRKIVNKSPYKNKSEWVAELLVEGYEKVKKDQATSRTMAV
jgi:hypothetical protein